MFFGTPIIDVLTFLVIGWVGAILFLPLGQWIDYKCDCKKYGKKTANEIWKRM